MKEHLRTGTVLGQYRIVAPLGAGGMGEVYRAHDSKLDRPVALKILPESVVRDADRVRRFVQEARSASSLSHPNIVHVYDIGEAVPVEEGGEPEGAGAAPVHFIAMELVEGRTLRQLLEDRSIEPRTLLSHLAQAAEGLAKAHASGIVHRDLKPENIMVTRDGYAKVLDFGLAKLTEQKTSGSALAAAPTAIDEMTKEGAVVGTVGYMSPEQAMGRPVDHRTDLFAFGCLLYEAATGRKPFGGESSVDVLHAIVRGNPTPVEEIAPTIPRALVRTIRRCLAKEPDRRYQSMRDLALELHEMVDEWETLALPSGTVSSASAQSGIAPPPKKRPSWSVAAAAVVVVLAAAAGIWLLRSGGGGSGRVQSIAVLPMLDISGADQLFVDAMYDQLIGSVGRLEDLSVVSRSAVQPFAKNPNVREVAAALKVDAVLEGSVFRAGEVMRINVQLTEPVSLRHLWSQSYEQNVSDVLAAQDAVVAKITGDLEAGLARQAEGGKNGVNQ